MDAEKTVQPPNSQKPVSWWSARRRICVVLILLFTVVFAASWWWTPIEPYAKLKLYGESGLFQFSPDGTMFVTSGKEGFGRSEGPLRVWDVAGGHERFSIVPDWKAIETVHFSPDNSLLAAHEMEGDLKIWNTKTGEEVQTIKPKTHFTNWVNFRFSPDGRFLVFQDYSKGWPDKDFITFWNIKSKRERGSVESYFHTLAFAPDGKSFATFRRKDYGKVAEVLLWKIKQAPVLVKQHRITASVVAFSPDLQTFATADDFPNGNGQVAMWDMLTGKKRWSLTFNEHGTHLQTLSFLANGKILISHGGGGTQLNWRWRTVLWDVTSAPKEIGSFSERPTVSLNGEWLAIPLDSGARLIKASAPEQGTDLVVKGDLGPFALFCINNMKFYPRPSFSLDSKTLVVAELFRHGKEPFLGKWLPPILNPFHAEPMGSLVRAWDVGSRKAVFTFSNCNAVWFSPDGQVLATLRDRQTIDLWKLPLRSSFWRILGWAVLAWLVVVVGSWLGCKTGKTAFRVVRSILIFVGATKGHTCKGDQS